MTPAEAIKILKEKQEGRNTQEVFTKLPNAETKERQKVDFFDLFNRLAGPKYQYTPEIITLGRYFLDDMDFDVWELCESKPNIFKGLYVYGPYGTGKSKFFDIIHHMARKLVVEHGYQGMWFTSVTAPWIVEEYMKATEKGYEGSFEFTRYYKGRLYIDDLGMERLAFGRDNIISDLLFERHRNGSKTFISSNLTPTEFIQRYGARLGDRLREAYNIIEFKGKSFRE